MPTDAPQQPILELRDVYRTFHNGHQVPAVAGVSFTAWPGEFVAITGASGSGKSTLLSLMGCLDIPTAGQVVIQGEEASHAGDARRTRLRAELIGFVFQQFHLVPHLSALANVELALLYRGISAAERRDRASAALDTVGLADRRSHQPAQLSGGEQQRVAIARAVVTDPAVILADEPTGNLDSSSAEMVLRTLEQCVTPARVLIVVTHSAEVADRAGRVVQMRDGRIVAEQTPVTTLASSERHM